MARDVYRMSPSMTGWLNELETTRVKGLIPTETTLATKVILLIEVQRGDDWESVEPIELPVDTRANLWVNLTPKNGGGKKGANRVTFKLPDGSAITIVNNDDRTLRIQPRPSGVSVSGKAYRRY